MGYESLNQMAAVSDEIRKYIQEIASTTVASNKKAAEFAANVSEESKAKDAQFQAMTSQIQALTNTVATLSTVIAAVAKNGDGGSGSGAGGGSGGGGGGSGGGGGGERTFKFARNMGAYCSTHDHQPVGMNHTSAACTYKRKGHNDLATANHCFGGSNFWPGLSKDKPSQQDHVCYKGKSANN